MRKSQFHFIITALTLSLSTNAFAQKPTVSSDLLQVYTQTESATTEDDFTKIARACAAVIPDQKRSKADREYAENLIAWALNRRGEVRGEAAAKLVEAGRFADASKLDRQAADDYETSLKYAPTKWRTVHNWAISLAMQGKYPQAIEQFSRVLELNDQYANAYFNRGELFFELKQYAPAIDDYTRAIELAPNDPQYYNSRGHCRFALNARQAAIEDYRMAVELGKDSAVYHTDLADAVQYLGQWDEAAKLYRQAIAINSAYGRAYQNAAWLMATCPDEKYRNTQLALSAAKRAQELNGDKDFRTLDTLAAATAASGNTSKAAEILQLAIQSAPVSERQELTQRLKLYQKGLPYVQPQTLSLSDAQTANEPLATPVVTASSRKQDTKR